MVTAAMKLIDACSLGENCDQPRQHIEKQRHYFADKYLSLEGLMLKLKLQDFGHWMQSTDSLEKPLMLGKTEGRRKRG